MKEEIINTIIDLVADFLYYDRKEDEDLKRGDIEKAIKNNEITIEYIVAKFEDEFRKGVMKNE